MGQLFEAIVEFFTKDEWPFSQVEGQTALRTAFKGDNGSWNCYARAVEEHQLFLFYSVCPAYVPEDKRLAMAEFLTRANYGLNLGNFELDFADGEVRYKTSVDVEGDELSLALVTRLVYANVLTMDTYLPGIMSVIYANVNPVEAIARIEENLRRET